MTTTGSESIAPGLQLNFCPHCGQPLTDRAAFGRLRRFCVNCQRVIFREHKVAAALVVTDDAGRVLLVQRAWNPMQGYWSLPAGFVDEDEAPAAAAIRECHEETGLEAEVTALLDVIAGREHPHGADVVIVYQGRSIGGTLTPADDATDAAFFAPEALPPLAFRATRQALARWRRHHETSD